MPHMWSDLTPCLKLIKKRGDLLYLQFSILNNINSRNMEAIELSYIKMLPTACTPTCATHQSIGLDLYSPVSVIISAHDKVLINTGVAFKIPMGYYGWSGTMLWDGPASPYPFWYWSH